LGFVALPSSQSSSDGSLCAEPLSTCFVDIFGPFGEPGEDWGRLGVGVETLLRREGEELPRGEAGLLFDVVEVRLE
jgi:hypothetical protein